MSRPIASGFTVCNAEHIAFDTAIEKKGENCFHRAHGYHIKCLLKVAGVLVSYLQPAQRDHSTDKRATHPQGGI